MDLQADIKWIIRELQDVNDPKLIAIFKDLLKSRLSDQEPEITKEQKELLDRRLEDHLANPDAGIDWQELKQSLYSKYGI
ncbi:MAG: addiction module protein [Leeuwenhoekiella sp.]|nr:MAG: addiction module protein [Leeuwenhoekiella sp.]